MNKKNEERDETIEINLAQCRRVLSSSFPSLRGARHGFSLSLSSFFIYYIDIIMDRSSPAAQEKETLLFRFSSSSSSLLQQVAGKKKEKGAPLFFFILFLSHFVYFKFNEAIRTGFPL